MWRAYDANQEPASELPRLNKAAGSISGGGAPDMVMSVMNEGERRWKGSERGRDREEKVVSKCYTENNIYL